MKKLTSFLTAALLLFLAPVCRAVTLEQIIPRENPQYNNANAELTVGRNGMVYLHSPNNSNGYVLRFTRDGKDKEGGGVGASTGNVAVNANGILAAGGQHFASTMLLFDRDFNRTGAVDEFTSWKEEFGEASGYGVPGRVEPGASGDFYGNDIFNDVIVRIAAEGKALKKYPIQRDGTGINSLTWDFRVNEKAELFYTRSRQTNQIRAVGFDGKEKWKAPLDTSGGWDVTDDGTVYGIGVRSDTVKKYDVTGKPAGEVKLSGDIADEGAFGTALQKYYINSLRVFGNEFFVKRVSPTEMYLRFDATGALKQSVTALFEKFQVTYPSEVWTAGQPVDFSISLSDPVHGAKPHWRVWARGLSTPDYRELKIVGGKLQVPADAAGIYQIKVTPEVQPWQRGLASEYALNAWVEVRGAGSQGTANVFTPENRASFGRGETVPFAVVLRAAVTAQSAAVPFTVRLMDTDGKKVLATAKATAKVGESVSMGLAPSLTAALAPGRYWISASAAGLTTIAQPIVIGTATPQKSPWLNVQYGDYEQPGFFPSWGSNATAYSATDLAAAHVQRTHKLGVNMVVERLGHSATDWTINGYNNDLAALRTRLAADTLGAAPQKALFANTLQQTMAGFSAYGMSQMSILLYMDTDLPVIKGNDTPEKIKERITTVTNSIKGYPSFRGWSWVANWWIWNPEVAYTSPEEKAAYVAALKKAKETGEWNAVLDKVGDHRFSFGVDAEKQFRSILDPIAPGRISALSGPYRSISVYPPASFANADEVDLHYQAEQIQPPGTIWHNVDYQKRPGKKAWGHPELWNDNGTGDQLLPGLFGLAMRGADGVGLSGPIPWGGRHAEDVRASSFGNASVWRNAFKLFNHYGPWLQTLEPSDRVAIVVSARMAKIDEWRGVGGEYFSRLFEAYNSCMYAHRPASYVFVEDLKPTTLQNYSAVIVAGQTVEFEPALLAALKAAKAKGIPVFADGTSREALVKEFTPIGVAFDKVNNDPSVWQDDSSQWRFADYFVTNAVVVSKALAKVAVPAETTAKEVLLTERRAEKGRYLWIVNNTVPTRSAGELWRIAKAITTREPIQTTLKVAAPGATVYDVFAMKPVVLQNGALNADLRLLPARLYAILPTSIERLALRGPAAPVAGQNFKWWLQVRDAADKPIAASVPVRLRLLAGSAVIEERFLASGSAGLGGTMAVPLTATSLTLEATELFSGKTTRLAFKTTAAALPVALDKPLAAQDAPASASGVKFAAAPAASDEDFGVHARDVVVSADGTTALVTAMNWGDNLYGLDVQTGKLKWSNRIGEHFTYAPQRLSTGFAVEGFDFKTPEGYHLYLAGNDGKPTRRFALFGLPKGGVNWAFSHLITDHANNFATAPDGSWVASAGDLGLAVWSKNGDLLWSQDGRKQRHMPILAAMGKGTLVVGDGVTATAYDAQSGRQQWQLKLGTNGQIFEGLSSRDGSLLALRTDVDNGRVFVIRAGKVVSSFLTKAEDLALSDDGSTLAFTTVNMLKVYDVAGGLKWSYGGDDSLHFPRLSPDNKRIVVTSELGAVVVLGMDGTVLHEEDTESMAAPAWLANGDLLLATWDGWVSRLDGKYARLWRSRLQLPGAARAAVSVPTSRMTNWTNADAKPGALTPNLLADTKAIIRVTLSDRPVELKNKVEQLTDGKPDAPALPWVPWGQINMVDSGWAGEMVMDFDTFRTQIRLTGITFAEDPQHPESWMRDANLEYWDVEKAQWIYGASLLSDSATHTHTFAKPIEAAKFRLVESSTVGVWPVGNIRFGEVVFHGEAIGASHPDVIAKRPRAVLFDEGDDLTKGMIGAKLKLDDAFSGTRSLSVEAGQGGITNYILPFGHSLPNWDFAIRENPQPGEYRWLQFAWKATSPQTTGISMLIGNSYPGGGLSVSAGDYKRVEGVLVEKRIDGGVPTQWKTVRIDMWDVLKKPIDLKCLLLNSNGGPAAFDQIVLGRTEADLPPQK